MLPPFWLLAGTSPAQVPGTCAAAPPYQRRPHQMPPLRQFVADQPSQGWLPQFPPRHQLISGSSMLVEGVGAESGPGGTGLGGAPPGGTVFGGGPAGGVITGGTVGANTGADSPSPLY